MNLINLTTKPITLRSPKGKNKVIEPDPNGSARVETSPGVECEYWKEWETPVPIYSRPKHTVVLGLPAPRIGTLFIVSAEVFAQCGSRTDVCTPGVGPHDEPIRDNEGNLVAVTRLIIGRSYRS